MTALQVAERVTVIKVSAELSGTAAHLDRWALASEKGEASLGPYGPERRHLCPLGEWCPPTQALAGDQEGPCCAFGVLLPPLHPTRGETLG